MNLSCTYLDLELAHPFVAGAGPMCDTLDGIRSLEDGGASAVVLRSLFEEQITREQLSSHGAREHPADSFGEALSYLPDPDEFVIGPHAYVQHVAHAKRTVDIPVIASLNGATPGGWLDYARLIEEAGADALELNLYDVVTDQRRSAAWIEEQALDIVSKTCKALSIPVAVKLSPFYTALPHFARELEKAGVHGLVLFNRYFEPDIDVENLEFRSHLLLSGSHELLLRLRWLSILSGQIHTSMAVSGGVHGVTDAVKAMMCGAHVAQMVSALLRAGPEILGQLRTQLMHWLEENEYDSLAQLQGSMSLNHCPNPDQLTRSNYVQVLQTWNEGVE